jgi:hypothetical protein
MGFDVRETITLHWKTYTHTNNKTEIEDFFINLIFRTDYFKLRRNDENCRGELFLE